MGTTHYFDWFHLPNLNYDNPEVQRFMPEAFTYWVREFDVDGFRVDAVWGIKERRPDWIDAFLAEMNRIKPDIAADRRGERARRVLFRTRLRRRLRLDGRARALGVGGGFGGIAPIGQAMVDVLTDSGQGYADDALVIAVPQQQRHRRQTHHQLRSRFLPRCPGDVVDVAGPPLPLHRR